MRLRLIIVVCLATISCLSASAQRTMSGVSNARLLGVYSGSSFGAEAFYSQYTRLGYWETGVTIVNYNHPTTSGVKLGSMHYRASGAYMFRLVGTVNRAVNLYAGAGAFLGYESIDPLKQLPANYNTGLKKGYFLYGLQAKMAAEFFLSERFCLTIEGGTPINFSSPLGFFRYECGIGFKILI